MEDEQAQEQTQELVHMIDPEKFKTANVKKYEAELEAAGGDRRAVDGNTRKRVAHLRFTPQRALAIIEHIRNGVPNRTAAAATGVTEPAFYKWIERGKQGEEGYAEFALEVERATAEAEIERLNRISQAAENGNWQADAWYLERRYPDRWAKKDRVDVGSDEPIKVKLSW